MLANITHFRSIFHHFLLLFPDTNSNCSLSAYTLRPTRFVSPPHSIEQLRAIGETFRIVDGSLIISPQSSPLPGSSWDESEGSFFTISKTRDLLQPSWPLQDESRIHQNYDGSSLGATWNVGQAFLRLEKTSNQRNTRETFAQTANKQKQWSLEIPEEVTMLTLMDSNIRSKAG